MTDVEYEYRPNLAFLGLGAVFFGVGAALTAGKAIGNDRGLNLNGAIELGPTGATAFYWAMTAGGAAFVLAFFALVYQRFTYRRRIVLGPTAMTVPASRWSHAEQEIAYRDVAGVAEQTFNGQVFLYVTHPGGRYSIVASMRPSKAAFAALRDEIAARVRAAAGEGYGDTPDE